MYYKPDSHNSETKFFYQYMSYKKNSMFAWPVLTQHVILCWYGEKIKRSLLPSITLGTSEMSVLCVC